MTDTKFYSATNHVFYSDNGTTTNIVPGSGQNLNITCHNLTVDSINADGGLIAEKIEVFVDSNDLGLNQLSDQQDLDQNTSGIYMSQGTSCAIMSSSQNPIRIACGGPKVNTTETSYGGALTYSSTAGANFTGPVVYQSNTFCGDYTGAYVDISDEGEWMTVSFTDSTVGSAPYVNLYRWGGSSYSYAGYPRKYDNYQKAKVSGNYLVLSNLSSGLAIHFFNGTSWSLQQTISTVSGIVLFDIVLGNRIYFLDDSNHLMIWTRSGTTWTELSDITLNLPMDSVINDISMNDSGTVLSVVRDNVYVEVYDSLELTSTFTNSYVVGSRVTPDGNFIFHFDGSEISIVTKVEGVWTTSANKTACTFVDNIACNNTRLVCGRTVLDTYGRVTVFHISPYTNSLVLADSVAADDEYNLLVESNYKNIEINATDITLTNRTGGATYINGSVDILGNLDVGGTMNFDQVNVGFGTAGSPSIVFGDDVDTGLYSTGDGNVDFSINAVNKMNLNSTQLTVPKLVCSGPHLKLNMYSTSQVQPFTNAVANAVEFKDDILIENTGLTKSAIRYSGAPNDGTRFTNSSGQTMKLMACWTVSSTGGTGGRVDMNIVCNGYSGVPLGRVTQDSDVGMTTASSCMFVLAAGQYFELSFICVPGQNISINAGNASLLQIYSLN